MDLSEKNILIVYTGGTIGMSTTPQGYAPELHVFLENVHKIEELHRPTMPKWQIICMNPLLDSSNVAVHEWNEIAQVIADNYDAYDGFVILHGTDTMAYTASALSFMLENLSKPVVFTGSQIPLCEIRNDARDNLITSIIIAADDRVHEVCLYFGGKLLRGNRAIKFSASDLIAFMSPNYPSLAEVGISITFNEAALLPAATEPFHLQKLEELPIGVIKVFPGIQFHAFESIMVYTLKAVVIETVGSGNIPANMGSLLPVIKKAFDHGTIVTVCSQCPHGTVSLGTYETSSKLKEAGAISGLDMTTEAAIAKLYYLFSCKKSSEEIKKEMEINLRGEISQ